MTHPNPPPSKSTYEEARDKKAKENSIVLYERISHTALLDFKTGSDWSRDYFASQLREKDEEIAHLKFNYDLRVKEIDQINDTSDINKWIYWRKLAASRNDDIFSCDAMIEKLEKTLRYVIENHPHVYYGRECDVEPREALTELEEWRKGQ